MFSKRLSLNTILSTFTKASNELQQFIEQTIADEAALAEQELKIKAQRDVYLSEVQQAVNARNKINSIIGQ